MTLNLNLLICYYYLLICITKYLILYGIISLSIILYAQNFVYLGNNMVLYNLVSICKIAM